VLIEINKLTKAIEKIDFKKSSKKKREIIVNTFLAAKSKIDELIERIK